MSCSKVPLCVKTKILKLEPLPRQYLGSGRSDYRLCYSRQSEDLPLVNRLNLWILATDARPYMSGVITLVQHSIFAHRPCLRNARDWFLLRFSFNGRRKTQESTSPEGYLTKIILASGTQKRLRFDISSLTLWWSALVDKQRVSICLKDPNDEGEPGEKSLRKGCSEEQVLVRRKYRQEGGDQW